MHKKVTSLTFEEFMDEFVPDVTTLEPALPATGKNLRSRNAVPAVQPAPCPKVNPFKDIGEYANERAMYGLITEALNNAGICPGYRFVATPHKGDASEKSGQAVDCGLYPDEALPKLELKGGGGYGRTDWSWIDLAIECKKEAVDHDPFDERKSDDEPTSDKRKEVLGQILSYIELIFRYQHRTFQYMLLFLGDQARLVRFDRSGIFVTHKFDYKENGLQLARFLWHYAQFPSALRGHDTTAARIDPATTQGKRMRAKVQSLLKQYPDNYAAKAFSKTLDPEWSWWRLEVPNETPGGKSRYFLVGKPHFQAPGVVGRTTRGYIALEDDEQKMGLVYLKDAWRIVNDEIEQEGKTLQFLHRKKVEYVPTVVCHGDIPEQRTLSQTVWPKYHPGEERKLKAHHHYRIVVEEVGKPLHEFTNGLELVYALWNCLTAHKQALESGIIHRDISAGNLLLHQVDGEWQGLLNDWELAKSIHQQEEEGRQPDRTGTWQFMSAQALNDHGKTIVIQDELESFFHVLLYITLRLLPHNCLDTEVPRLLYDYFDDYSPLQEGYRCGPLKLTTMTTGFLNVAAYVKNKKDPIVPLMLLFDKPAKPANSAIPAADDPQQEGGAAEKEDDGTASDRDRTEKEEGTPAEPVDKDIDYASLPKHPLDDIVRQLLHWFGAHYALSSNGMSGNPARNREADAPVPKQATLIKRAKERAMARAKWLQEQDEVASWTVPQHASAAVSSIPPLDSQVLTADASREQLEARAKMLQSHDPMMELLEDAINKKAWPAVDRCDDRKPKKRLPKPDRVPAGFAALKGTKRDSAAFGDDVPRTPSKRSKAA